jgi:NADH:ubiquinone oxidoreductase subunit 4 (subunit M)
MLLSSLLLIPIIGVFVILVYKNRETVSANDCLAKIPQENVSLIEFSGNMKAQEEMLKKSNMSIYQDEDKMPVSEMRNEQVQTSNLAFVDKTSEDSGLNELSVNKDRDTEQQVKNIKFIALTCSILNLLLSIVVFILFDFSTNQFQFVQEYHQISYFDFYLGIDGLSIYFVLLTTIIIPISLLSN